MYALGDVLLVVVFVYALGDVFLIKKRRKRKEKNANFEKEIKRGDCEPHKNFPNFQNKNFKNFKFLERTAKTA